MNKSKRKTAAKLGDEADKARWCCSARLTARGPDDLVRDLDGNDLVFTDETVSACEGAPTQT